MTPKEQADEAHRRQRKHLWLEVYLECMKKPNAGWEYAWHEASKAVECFDEQFRNSPLFNPKQPNQ